MTDLRAFVRDVPGWPQPGILFRDATPLFSDAAALRSAIDILAAEIAPLEPQIIVGPEARGFSIGTALAYVLGAGFVGARKEGKLPRQTVSAAYALEYGVDRLEIHVDAFSPGTRVVVHDDLLATGGTVRAAVDLVQALGGVVVGAAFLIELAALDGRRRIDPIPVTSLITYP